MGRRARPPARVVRMDDVIDARAIESDARDRRTDGRRIVVVVVVVVRRKESARGETRGVTYRSVERSIGASVFSISLFFKNL